LLVNPEVNHADHQPNTCNFLIIVKIFSLIALSQLVTL